MSEEKEIRILAVGDSPTSTSGFAEVMRQVLTPWAARPNVSVTIWGIGFTGRDYWKYPQFRLLPEGGAPDKSWHLKLGQVLALLDSGQFTHVFLLNDLSAFTATDFPRKLRHVCAIRKVRSLLYFPVDAPQDRAWCEIIQMVDTAVSYTQYGVDQVRAAGCRTPLEIVPHGVDAEFFHPVAAATRKEILKEILVRPTPNSARPFAGADDFLLLNVNKNEWRKDPFRSLEILAALKNQGLPVKMIFRMAPVSAMAGVALESAGAALGLKVDEDFIHLPAVTPETLRELYNAADLYLTTTLGEGWGLGITEALACGCPVAIPNHTSCAEIMQGCCPRGVSAHRFVLIEAGERMFGPIDSRLRRRMDLAVAVEEIASYYKGGEWRVRPPLPDLVKEWLSWPRISARMFELLTGQRSNAPRSGVQDAEAEAAKS